MNGHSDREAKGVLPRLVEPLGEVKKGVDPPRVLDVELPSGVMSYAAPPLRLKHQYSNSMMGLSIRNPYHDSQFQHTISCAQHHLRSCLRG